MYLEQELRQIVEEVDTKMKFSPFQLSDQATDQALSLVSTELVQQACQTMSSQIDL